ncbi:MAG TPA: 1-(5-phosphoribosyl)-5-[(5-phosphoribosylamino)methylideneamino]imidazole-4-carboxamide isomerase [Cyclobacteriaceae bacterium]
MIIIPAIDIIDGKCVRLEQGDFNRIKNYNSDPLNTALTYQDHGIKHLHLVDLDAAKSKRLVHTNIVEEICKKTTLSMDYGGGISTKEDVDILLGKGVDKVNIGSLAIHNPDLFKDLLRIYSGERIILSADVRNESIAVNGWQETTGDQIYHVIEKHKPHGLQYVACTDISKDGLLSGPSIDLYKKILESFDTRLIASGGISSMEDLHALKEIGCYGAIIGKALYEQKITLTELSAYVD